MHTHYSHDGTYTVARQAEAAARRGLTSAPRSSSTFIAVGDDLRSTRITGEGSDWSVDGELTIAVEAFFDGTRHAGFEATGEIRRKDFGLGFGPLGATLGDVVKIELDLQFVEPASQQ